MNRTLLASSSDSLICCIEAGAILFIFFEGDLNLVVTGAGGIDLAGELAISVITFLPRIRASWTMFCTSSMGHWVVKSLQGGRCMFTW
ncbi:hypothetical protein OK016_29635 [Vibrio chagasii]|nr:hypothetical protein [Vibrio chagasii]